MKFIILPLFILLQLAGAHAQSVIHLQDTGRWRPIGKYTSYLRDSGYSDVQKILQPGVQSRFKPYNQDAPNFGSTADAVWFRFNVTKDIDKDFYLQVGSAFIDSIALYAVNGNTVQQVQLSGDNYVFSQREIKVTTFLFPLTLPQGAQQTYLLRAKTMQPFFFPLRVGTLTAFMEDTHKLDLIQGIYLGFMLLIFLYNLFLFFSTREKLYLFYVAYVASITWFMSSVYQYVFEYLWPGVPLINEYAVASSAITMLTATVFTREFLHTRKQAPRLHKFSWCFIAVGFIVFVLVFTAYKLQALMIAQAGILLMAIYFLIAGITVYRKGYHPAKFYLVAWTFLIAGFIAAILESVNVLPVMYYLNAMQVGSAIEVTLLSLALADRINVYKKEREEAQAKALKVAHEKAELVLQQNILLEQNVAQRTIELTKSLNDLKDAQAQLVQSEKMASLGELTAGVAHEIQNPLNFINNFSELNSELLRELVQEIEAEHFEEVKLIADDINMNNIKIVFHGRRADGIVKSMLQHSRKNTGQKENTDINDLCDEYLRLSYHGLRAKDKSFNAEYKTGFDESIGRVQIVPQDIGRVLLNLFNNAFYAVNEKRKQQTDAYKPVVLVTTRKLDAAAEDEAACIEIKVQDNGTGIPEKLVDKIFQPFFTTKPAGQGTGLGLSLAYDIITKQHKGTIAVESKEGEGTTFIIHLPVGKADVTG